MKPTLFLIPTPLGLPESPCLPECERQKILHLKHFAVEVEKTARSHLKAFGIQTPLREVSMNTLENASERLNELLQPLRQGFDMGLLSEAGCPAIADPGAKIVAAAHREGFTVMPLVGPSSIIMALMASGANGQEFTFHGYLPADTEGRKHRLKQLEQQRGISHIFIETPYRNRVMLTDAIDTLHPETLLCIAADITLPEQCIISRTIAQWRKQELPDIHKRPCIFIIHTEKTRRTTCRAPKKRV